MPGPNRSIVFTIRCFLWPSYEPKCLFYRRLGGLSGGVAAYYCRRQRDRAEGGALCWEQNDPGGKRAMEGGKNLNGLLRDPGHVSVGVCVYEGLGQRSFVTTRMIFTSTLQISYNDI